MKPYNKAIFLFCCMYLMPIITTDGCSEAYKANSAPEKKFPIVKKSTTFYLNIEREHRLYLTLHKLFEQYWKRQQDENLLILDKITANISDDDRKLILESITDGDTIDTIEVELPNNFYAETRAIKNAFEELVGPGYEHQQKRSRSE